VTDKQVTQAEIADVLSVTTKTIRNLEALANPLPSIRVDGKNVMYDVPSVVTWYVDYCLEKYKRGLNWSPTDLREEEFKEQQAKTRLAVMKADKEEGLLVLAADAKAEMVKHISRAARVLNQMPHKVAMAISGDMPYAEKKLEAEKIKSQFLEELADTQ